MGLLYSLFGKMRSPEQQVQEARVMIHEAKQMGGCSPEKVLKYIQKQSRHLYNAIGLNGPVHNEFVELLLFIWKTSHPESISTLPSVETIPWSTWPRPMIKNLSLKAHSLTTDILFLTAPSTRHCTDAFAEVQALKQFAENPDLVMIIIGEEDMLFRRSYILEASARLQQDCEEIAQEVIDDARSTGKTVIY